VSAVANGTQGPNSLSASDQAAALWTFVHLKIPRFTTAAALNVVEALAPAPDEEPKLLARRLRKELERFGVALKHVNAIEAAVRLQGQRSWHGAERVPPRAGLKVFGVLEQAEKSAEFGSWVNAAKTLADWAEAAVRHSGLKVLELQVAENYVLLTAPWVTADKGRKVGQSLPVFLVNPLQGSPTWLDGAASALETVRRRIEETGLAVLEGLANLQCVAAAVDAPNTELVLVQTPGEPEAGFEIARGTEITCWAQFDLARAESSDASTVVTAEGVAWRRGRDRFVWQVCTARADGPIPSVEYAQLGVHEVAHLLHRYRLARRVMRDGIQQADLVKMMPLFGAMASVFRVRPDRIRTELAKAGRTWEDFIRGVDDPPELSTVLPAGILLQLVGELRPSNPNIFFASPPREHLVHVHDDKMLRSMIPQLDHVRFRLTPSADDSLRATVKTAVEELYASMRMRKMTAMGVIKSSEPLPDLVYSGDAQDLLDVLYENGLTVFVGSMPYLVEVPEEVRKAGVFNEGALPEPFPYALGNSLFLDIDFAEVA
jgi:hypothetical protein